MNISSIDSTTPPAEAVFQSEVNKLKQDQFKPFEQVTLESYERDDACGWWIPFPQEIQNYCLEMWGYLRVKLLAEWELLGFKCELKKTVMDVLYLFSYFVGYNYML